MHNYSIYGDCQMRNNIILNIYDMLRGEHKVMKGRLMRVHGLKRQQVGNTQIV